MNQAKMERILIKVGVSDYRMPGVLRAVRYFDKHKISSAKSVFQRMMVGIQAHHRHMTQERMEQMDFITLLAWIHPLYRINYVNLLTEHYKQST